MKLIVGLGNPGEKYVKTRHNVGFMVVDKAVGGTSWAKSKSASLLYAWKKYDGEKVEFVKPQTFMNESGSAVTAVFKNHPELVQEDLIVVHDDLDIKLGEYKIVKGKGPREHKGLLSIYDALNTKNFWHVRVGIENREGKSQITNNKSQTNLNSQIQNSKQNTTHNTPSTKHIPGEKYVLMNFTEEEMIVVQDVVEDVVDKLLELVKDNS